MARRRIWALVRKRSRGGVAHNAGPHLTQHETDHHIRIPWVLGSHENERSCEVFELPVPLLDDAATRLFAPLPFHYHGSRYSRRRQQMLITGYASSSSCFPRFLPFTPSPLSSFLSYVIPIFFNPSAYFASWERPPWQSNTHSGAAAEKSVGGVGE